MLLDVVTFLLRRIDVVVAIVAFAVVVVVDDCAEDAVKAQLLLLLLHALDVFCTDTLLVEPTAEVLLAKRGWVYPLSSCGKPLTAMLSGLILMPTAILYSGMTPFTFVVVDDDAGDVVAMVDNDDEETGFVVAAAAAAAAVVVVVDGVNDDTAPLSNDLVVGRNLTE